MQAIAVLSPIRAVCTILAARLRDPSLGLGLDTALIKCLHAGRRSLRNMGSIVVRTCRTCLDMGARDVCCRGLQ